MTDTGLPDTHPIALAGVESIADEVVGAMLGPHIVVSPLMRADDGDGDEPRWSFMIATCREGVGFGSVEVLVGPERNEQRRRIMLKALVAAGDRADKRVLVYDAADVEAGLRLCDELWPGAREKRRLRRLNAMH